MTLANVQVPTQRSLAEFLRKPERTVGRWIRQHGMPKPPCSLQDVVAWLIARTPTADMKEQLDAAKLELTQEQARAQRRENDEAERRLLPAEFVNRMLAGVFVEFRESKVAIADSVANLLPPESRELCRAELDRLERESLRRARIKIQELNSALAAEFRSRVVADAEPECEVAE